MVRTLSFQNMCDKIILTINLCVWGEIRAFV